MIDEIWAPQVMALDLADVGKRCIERERRKHLKATDSNMPTYTVRTVLEVKDDVYPEDNRVYTIDKADWTRDVERAIANDEVEYKDTDAILQWIVDQD